MRELEEKSKNITGATLEFSTTSGTWLWCRRWV
jgi:hypothetical protein